MEQRLIAIAVLLTLTACAAPKYNYMPSAISISEPPLNSVNTSQVGDVMLRQGKYEEHDAIFVSKKIDAGILAPYTIHPGYYLKHGEDQTGEYYQPGGEGAGHVEKAALADQWKSILAMKGKQILCVVTVFNATACSDESNFDRQKKPVLSRESFQQTLIYSGKMGNKINIGYREFSGNLARPAFNNDVEYDLSESKIIGYKGAQLEILEATNQHIKFKVIRNFNNAAI